MKSMTISSAQLLKHLEPAVRPGAAPPSTSSLRGPIEAQNFSQLLARASEGSMHSGLPIELAFEPSPPLDLSQLERLAAAADQAQAAGAQRALMLIDGRGFVLDVQTRTLTAELSSNDPAGDPYSLSDANGSHAQIVNIDAAVYVGDAGEALFEKLLGPPAMGIVPPSIAQELHASSDQDDR